MKTLEEILCETLGVDYSPMTEKEKQFWKVSTKDCLKAMEAAVNAKLQEAAEKVKNNKVSEDDRWDEGFNRGIEASEKAVKDLKQQ